MTAPEPLPAPGRTLHVVLTRALRGRWPAPRGTGHLRRKPAPHSSTCTLVTPAPGGSTGEFRPTCYTSHTPRDGPDLAPLPKRATSARYIRGSVLWGIRFKLFSNGADGGERGVGRASFRRRRRGAAQEMRKVVLERRAQALQTLGLGSGGQRVGRRRIGGDGGRAAGPPVEPGQPRQDGRGPQTVARGRARGTRRPAGNEEVREHRSPRCSHVEPLHDGSAATGSRPWQETNSDPPEPALADPRLIPVMHHK